jgi:hypothetical protein
MKDEGGERDERGERDELGGVKDELRGLKDELRGIPPSYVSSKSAITLHRLRIIALSRFVRRSSLLSLSTKLFTWN